jgi:tRNA(Ile2) C34 agmatinyltransferase TiaS
VSFTLYFSLFAVCLLVCMLVSAVVGRPTRSCPDCGEQTATDGRRCRHCGYRLGRV